MSIEYQVIRVPDSMDEEALNKEGREGWKLAAVHSTTEPVEVSYNVYADQACVDYYFWRELPDN